MLSKKESQEALRKLFQQYLVVDISALIVWKLMLDFFCEIFSEKLGGKIHDFAQNYKIFFSLDRFFPFPCKTRVKGMFSFL